MARRLGPRAGAAVPLASVAATITEKALKREVGRRRPSGARSSSPTRESYPSGHATVCAATGATLVYVLAREKVIDAFPGALVVGAGTATVAAAKLFREDHWLTDILGGLALGLEIAAASCAGYEATAPTDGHEA